MLRPQKENPPTPGLGIPYLALVDALLLLTLALMGFSLLTTPRNRIRLPHTTRASEGRMLPSSRRPFSANRQTGSRRSLTSSVSGLEPDNATSKSRSNVSSVGPPPVKSSGPSPGATPLATSRPARAGVSGPAPGA